MPNKAAAIFLSIQIKFPQSNKHVIFYETLIVNGGVEHAVYHRLCYVGMCYFIRKRSAAFHAHANILYVLS
jgi:hypothetical protein